MNLTNTLSDPIVKEKLFHVLAQGTLMGLLSPGDTLGERAAGFGAGAILGGMRVHKLTSDQLRKLQTQSFRSSLPDIGMHAALGGLEGGLSSVANDQPFLPGVARSALWFGGSDAMFQALNRIRGMRRA